MKASKIVSALLIAAETAAFSFVIFLAIDGGTGRNGPPEAGRITDKIYRPPYTTTRWVPGKDGKPGRMKKVYHPATYHFESASKSATVCSSVARDTYYRYTVGAPVTLQEAFGRWSKWSYGWRLTRFSAPDFSVETP